MGYQRCSILLVLWAVLPARTVQGQAVQAQPDYRNPALPTARRVDDLLARMTLEEKVAQMMCLWSAKKQFTDAQGRFDPARAPEWFKVGIGRIERPSDSHGAVGSNTWTGPLAAPPVLFRLNETSVWPPVTIVPVSEAGVATSCG